MIDTSTQHVAAALHGCRSGTRSNRRNCASTAASDPSDNRARIDRRAASRDARRRHRHPTRALIVATGARYRSLPLERWNEFVGAGIFYAATELEIRSCANGPVTVVGGGNAAGQAAIFLASCGSDVTVAIRRPDIERGMSRYLVDRLFANPR